MSWYLLGVITQQAIDSLPTTKANELEDICNEMMHDYECTEISTAFYEGQNDFNHL